MENKINIAELLKDCPKGMELDCVIYDNCTYEGIEDVGYIDILINTPSGRIRLTKEGCYIRHDDNAKCVIFPKGKTSWEGFVPPCKFKVGDKIGKCGYRFTIAEVKDDYYLTKCGNKISIENQDDFSLVPNKFDITTLKPFESKVLVRDGNSYKWEGSIFTRYAGNYLRDYPFITLGGECWKQCIPYEGNEHLLGTTDDCDEFYKTW